MARFARAVAIGLAFASALAAQEPTDRPPLGPGPSWRGPVRPTARNEVFATADGCAMCHSASPRATAMRDPTGQDVSPHALWRGSVMANAFRDPFFRAQVEREVAADPERAEEVQAMCVRCHAPMVSHSRRLAGQAPATPRAVAGEPMADDGVSCTVCHQIQAQGLGTVGTWAGKGRIEKGRRIFGPFPNPSAGPMQQFAGYQVVHGAHVQSAGLCATCHTLHTEHTGETFPEQTPYLEWRNSEFSDEEGRTGTSRTCQQCHMADLGRTRIARDPAGAEFLIEPRGPHRSHSFVGGNAFLLDLLADNHAELRVDAPVESLRKNAVASRRLLAEDTVRLSIDEPVRRDGALHFGVRVENLTGHKFPTGFPSRRAWLQVMLRDSRGVVVFESGRYTKEGRLLDVADELREEHHALVTRADQVVVWEMIAEDADGEPTTLLTAMRTRAKDNRLLPRGWRRDGPHAADTSPVGIGTDLDFTPGGDTVAFAVPLDARAPTVTVIAWVQYQTVPPHWVEPLRGLDTPETRAFVRMYDATARRIETIATAVREEDR